MRGPANVYIIAERDGPRKIGISDDPAVRMRELRDRRAPLSVVATYPRETGDARIVERVAHRLLAEKRVIGEWFDVTDDEAIAAVREAIALVDSGDPISMRKVPTKIMIDSELMDRLDQAADEMDRSRSYIARLAFEEFLASRSSPPGGVRVSPMLGPPATAVGRGFGLSYPLEAPPGSTSHTQENSLMAVDPYKQMKDDLVERQRRFQEQRGEAQTSNQGSRNAEAGSPAPKPRGAGHDDN